uniref:Uncharacterized protein n=1 Tax=Melopsittacus undulatus TaxID=13146 RepID=A0A8C6NBZ4_MELUD
PCPLSTWCWEPARYCRSAPAAREGSAPLTASLNEPVGYDKAVAVLKRAEDSSELGFFGCRVGQQTSVDPLTGSLVLSESAYLQRGKCGDSACRLVSMKPLTKTGFDSKEVQFFSTVLKLQELCFIVG